MGMSASQARLLSITARLSDNEACAQSVSYAKQRLADETQQINEAYNKALMKTKLSAITGYNDSGAILEDISYALLTDERMRTGKQYVITDTKGRVLVESDVANAFNFAHGDLNVFLAEMGYSQTTNNSVTINSTDETAKAAMVQEIENAWDKYYDSVGIKFPDDEHNNSSDLLLFSFNKNSGSYGYALRATQTNPYVQMFTPYSIDTQSTTVQGGSSQTWATISNKRDCKYKYDYSTGNYEQVSENDDPDTYHDVVVGETKYNAIDTNHPINSLPANADSNLYYYNYKEHKYYKFCVNDLGTNEPDGYMYNGYVNNNDFYLSTDGHYYEFVNYYDDNGTQTTSNQYAPSGTWQSNTNGYYYGVNIEAINVNSTTGIGQYMSFSTNPILDESKFEPVNYEGTSSEQRELYDKAVALTKSYIVGNSYRQKGANDDIELKTLADNDNKSAISYYTNLFNKMMLNGYYTYTNSGAGDENHIRVTDLSTTVIKDSALLMEKIKTGELYLEFYSATDKKFKSTTVGEDDTVTEVEDESAISKAEIKYEQDLKALEQRDKRFDLELKKLDTEHNALQTEYDAVKNIISKNVQNSFKTFNA